MLRKLIFFILLSLPALNGTLLAQAPDTDIFLFDIDLIAGRVNFRNLLRVTDREGYDNQPTFTPDGRHLLFSSIGEDNQSDIYRYTLSSGQTERLTFTPESEYSPLPIPGSNKYSVVRVEKDSSQCLWKYWPQPGGKVMPLFPSLTDIGYHAWMDNETLALWRLGDPPTLELVHRADRFPSEIATHIGRCLQMMPHDWVLTFLDRSESPTGMIRSYGMISKEFKDIVAPLPGSEDFCWSPDGYLLMGSEGKLYSFFPGKDEKWRYCGDLGIGPFSRMTFSPDGKKLAVVAND